MRIQPAFAVARACALVLAAAFAVFHPTVAAQSTPNTCAPLGAAGGYNGFFAETFQAQSSDVEGRLAAGGNVSINHYSIADKLPATTTGGTLVVGGNLTFPSGRVYVGDILVRGSAAGVGAAVINGLGPNQRLVANATMPVDFTAEFTRLRTWSDRLATLPANGTWISQWGGLTLRGDNTSALQVFSLPGDVVMNSHTFAVERIPAGATVLFNISGASAGLRNMSLESLAAHRTRTLFNFPQATSLTLTSIGVQGSILAPRAVINNPQGVVIGQVIARSWNGMMQLNVGPFVGCGLPGDNNAPAAQPQTLTTPEDTPLPITLAGTDPDGDALTFVVLTQPSHGTLSGTAPNVVYTPAPGYSGPDTFTFRVDDGRAQSAPATVSITVTPGDDPPQAFDSHVYTDEDVPVALVLGASDPDGDPLTYTLVGLPAHGTLSGTAPNLSYQPAANFHGEDRLTFRVNDGHGDSNLATVTITVRPINDAPLADDKNLALEQGASAPVVLTGSDPDGDALGFRVVEGPTHGTLSGTAPNLVYTANAGYSGDDTFRYVANDGALDSPPALVRIVVTERNQPPTIVTLAPTTVLERAAYRYDADATDPNVGDVITWNLPHGAAGMSVDGASGVVAWPSDPALVGSNLLPNAQCAIGGGTVGSIVPAADVVMVVDESGSMAGEHEWIADMAAPLEAHLTTNGVGAGALPNRYGLIGYEAAPRPINVGATAMGNYRELITATAQLRTPGGTEDGWRGILHGLNQYPLREDSARNVILITDEDRDIVDTALTYDSMLASLRAKKAVLNAVVNARFRCGDNTIALGMGQNRVGYKADGRGGFVTCANVTATSGDGTTLRDYVDLALATGGAAWDIEVLRDGGLLAQSFTNALLKIKVQEILQQIPADPQPDLYVQALDSRGGDVRVEVGNRGLAAVTQPFVVRLFADGVAFADATVDALPAGGLVERRVTFTGADPNLIRAAIVPPAGLVECKTDNNDLAAVWARLRATDRGGLYDEEVFTVSVLDANEAPAIVSTAPLSAAVGGRYAYVVEARDPDRGDALAFSLGAHPIGMTIDRLTGAVSFLPDASQAGSHPVTIIVRDLAGLETTQNYTLVVGSTFLPPRFTSTPERRAVQGTRYAYLPTVQADATAQLAFDVFWGPPGFAMDGATGAIGWDVPADYAGKSQRVVLRVRDQFGNYDLQLYTLLGDLPNQAPRITSSPGVSATIGSTYSYSATVADVNVLETFSWRSDIAPAGMTVNATTGAVSWAAASVAATKPAAMAVANPQCLATDAVPFTPGTRWFNSVLRNVGQPLIGPLADSNLDGRVDTSDLVAVIAVSNNDTSVSTARLHAINAATGVVMWSFNARVPNRLVTPAMADLTGGGEVSVLVVDTERRLVAVKPDGSLRWVSAAPIAANSLDNTTIGVADLDGDGRAEILVGPAVFDANGVLLWQFPTSTTNQGHALALDVDGDGRQEVLYRGEVRRADGTLAWKTPAVGTSGTVYESFFAPAQLSGGTRPDIVVSERTSANYRLVALRADGSVIWQLAAGPLNAAGPPLVGDFASSPGQEIFLAATGQLYSAAGQLLWNIGGTSTWSNGNFRAALATDIDADGKLDILSLGNSALNVLAGETGATVARPAWSSTSFAPQLPVLADPAGNGRALMLVGESGGVRAMEAALGRWPVEARVVNQHAYAADRIGTNMRAPAAVANAPVAPLYVFGAAQSGPTGTVYLSDLRISAPYGREGASGVPLAADVINRGTAASRPASVSFYRGADAQEANLLGRVDVAALQPGQSVTVTAPAVARAALGTDEIAARVNPATDEIECETGNNFATGRVMQISVLDHGALEGAQAWVVGVNERMVAPVFSTTALRVGVENQPYVYAARAATPHVGDAVRYALTAAPAGAVVNPNTGAIAWTPRWGQTGRFNFTLQATSLNGQAATQSWPVDVTASTEPNTPPRIVSTALTAATVGQVYRYDVRAVDDEGHPVTFALTQAPAGMQIDAELGTISWVPGSATPDRVNVTVTAKDVRQASATQTFEVRIYATQNRAPTITSTPVLTGAPGAPYRYVVTATDPDGDPLTTLWNVKPDNATVVPADEVNWTPRPDQLGAQAFEVEVRDNRGGWSKQTFTVYVNDPATNTSPQITSTPGGVAVIGQTYTYAVIATDADNDTLGYAFDTAPGGMAIDAATGVVTFVPVASQAGDHAVRVRVTDGRGGVAWQSWTLRVTADAGGNHAPRIVSAPAATAKVGRAYRYDVIATDQDNDTLAFSLTQAPAGVTIDTATGRIDYTPTAEGDFPLRVRVSDGQAWVEQIWTLHVGPEAPLDASIVINPPSALPGETITIAVVTENAAGQVVISVTVDGQTVPLAPNQTATIVAPSTPGQHTVVVTVGDGFETVTETSTFIVRDPAGGNGPVVSFATPLDDALVTAPTSVTGSVLDTDLVGWTLSIRDRNGGAARQIATGTTNVSAAALGQVDPTLMLNGQYVMILTATDAAGNQASAVRSVTVDGDMKLGHYSVTFEEASIPVAGVPIRVTRTYDTRRSGTSLDFGHGWTVDYNNVRVHESRRIGFGWGLYEYRNGFFSNWCVQPNGDPIVTVTMPDGDVQRFRAKASPECQFLVPVIDVQIVFEAMPGTTSKLEQTDYGQVRLAGSDIIDLGDPDGPIDADHYRLTTADGLVYDVDQFFGLRKVTDPEGQSLTYTREGVRHSSGIGVDFVRDAQGRIVQMNLPGGTTREYRYSSAGNLDQVIDEMRDVTRFAYLPPRWPHYLRDIVDARNIRISRSEYDDDGRLIATIDADGRRIEFTHDVVGRVQKMRDRRGYETTYLYDANGWVLSETNHLGETITRTYDGNGNVLTEKNALGQTTTKTYDARGNVLTSKNAANETTTRTFHASNQVLTEVDTAGRTVMTNTVNDRSKLITSTTDALGNKVMFAHDSGIGSGSTGELTGITDALGNRVAYGVNGNGWRTSETDALGNRTTFTHDAQGRVKTQTSVRTDASGATVTLVTTNTYDDKGRITRVDNPDGTYTTAQYNGVDLPTQACDAQSRCTTFVYDARGKETERRHPDGSVERKTYDENGNVASKTDRGGRTTKYRYDVANRLTETIFPDDTPGDDADNPFRSNVYDAAGRLTSTSDERGNTTVNTYDDADRLLTTTNARNETTTYTYVGGRRATMRDALGRTTKYVYDNAGKLTETILPDTTTSDTDNPRVKIEYDAASRKVADIDGAGRIVRYAYDKAARLIRVVLPNPLTNANPPLVDGESPDTGTLVTRYAYDENGNKLRQTDAAGRATTWTYDNAGRVLTRRLPLGQTERWTYDAVGRPDVYTDMRGRATTFRYKPASDLLATIDYPNQPDVAFDYTPAGKVASVVDGNGTTSYGYDVRDRLVRLAWPNGHVLDWRYDAAGNRIETKTANQTIGYTYDVLNRLTDVTPTNGGGAHYDYDAVGNRSALVHANGARTDYVYNPRNQLTNLTHKAAGGATLLGLVYTLDNAGVRRGLTESGSTARTYTYTYDGARRLTREQLTATGATRSIAWTYDAAGNRLTETRTGTLPSVTTNTYDDNDRLTQGVVTGTGAGTTTYVYDDAGNLTERRAPGGIELYGFDDAGRLAQHTAPGGAVTRYAYAHDGTRLAQTANADGASPATTHYVVDPTHAHAQVIEEHAQAGSGPKTLAALYAFGDDRISQFRPANGPVPAALRHYHADGLGSTRVLTDAASAVTDRYHYQAFGALDASTSTIASGNDFLYTGEALDPNSGYYYLRARYMDPRTGRFASPDAYPGEPTQPLTLHKYTYANLDPIWFTDPSGYFGIGGIVDIGLSLNLQGMTRVGTAQGGRIVMRQILFGKPPESLGVIGEMVLDAMVKSVLDVALLGDFESKGTAGTAAHQKLKSYMDDVAKQLRKMNVHGITVHAEPFADDDGEHYGKGRKGSVGIDVLIKYQGKNVIGFDLKIGKGYSREGIRKRRSYFGDVVQVYIDVAPK